MRNRVMAISDYLIPADRQFFDHPILNSPYEAPERTGSWTRPGSRRSRSSSPAARPSSSPRSRSRRSGRDAARRRCLRRGQGPLDEEAAVRPDVASSTRSDTRSTTGGRPIRTSGRSRPRPPACSSTGGTTSSAASARSSARSRPSRPPSGSPRSRPHEGGQSLLEHLAAPTARPTPSLMRLA
jgi:hypothetical protein